MIVVRLYEGLGNQLFQYAMGRALAERHHVPLRLDASWFDGNQWGSERASARRAYKLNAFCIEALPATVRDMAYCATPGGWLPRLRDKVLRRGGRVWPRVREPSMLYQPAAARTGPNAYLDGYWQTEKYFSDVAPILRREFTLRESPATQQAADAARVYRQDGRPLVSLHVRRGDLVPFERNGELIKNYGPPTSPQYVQRAMAQFGDDVRFVVVAEPAERAWCRQHVIGSNVVYFDGQSDLADFAMLKCCDHHIVANSTFSWWASWLNERPGKRVIAPTPWFWPDSPEWRVSDDLVPKDWIRIDSGP